jgi:polygalacturonase
MRHRQPLRPQLQATHLRATHLRCQLSGGGKILFDGYDHDHRAAVRLDNVFLTDQATQQYTYTINDSDETIGPGPSNLQIPAGTDSTITGKPSEGKPTACEEKFVPFPTP